MPIQEVDQHSEHASLPAMPKQTIHQLQPFNEFRFDDCMAYLAGTRNRSIAVYEMMKLHVMIDVHHTLERARPVIGGRIYPFTQGPVSRSSKSRVSAWQRQYEKTGKMPDGFELVDNAGVLYAKPTLVPDADDFSGSELTAMDLAWRDVIELIDKRGFAASQAFFHRDGFIGKAWLKAKQLGRDLDWNDIIDEYDREHSSDHSRIKAMLCI